MGAGVFGHARVLGGGDTNDFTEVSVERIAGTVANHLSYFRGSHLAAGQKLLGPIMQMFLR